MSVVVAEKVFRGQGYSKTSCIFLCGRGLWAYKANSAFHPSEVGKWGFSSAGNEKADMIHSVNVWTRGVQVKLWDPLRTRAIPERLRGAFTTRRYTNPHLFYLTFGQCGVQADLSLFLQTVVWNFYHCELEHFLCVDMPPPARFSPNFTHCSYTAAEDSTVQNILLWGFWHLSRVTVNTWLFVIC